jgi:hypothetical protein
MKRNSLLFLLVIVLLAGLAFLAGVGRHAPTSVRPEPTPGIAQTDSASRALAVRAMLDQLERMDPAQEPLPVEPKPAGMSDFAYELYLRNIARVNRARRGFQWLDASAIEPEKITRILAKITPHMTNRTANRANASSGPGTVVGRSPPRRGSSPEWRPAFPINKNDVWRYLDQNVSMMPGSGPIAGVEINGIFLLSNSDGPREDFTRGTAVVAATGQMIDWHLLTPEQEEAIKNAPVRDPWDTRGARSGGGGP